MQTNQCMFFFSQNNTRKAGKSNKGRSMLLKRIEPINENEFDLFRCVSKDQEENDNFHENFLVTNVYFSFLTEGILFWSLFFFFFEVFFLRPWSNLIFNLGEELGTNICRQGLQRKTSDVWDSRSLRQIMKSNRPAFF